MQQPAVYIIIVNYIQWQDTRECVESILQSGFKNYKIFIVDNASPNNSIAPLQGWMQEKFTGNYKYWAEKEFRDSANSGNFASVNLIAHERNGGFASGNNLVLYKLVNEDGYVWLLNPDMIVRNDTMERLVKFAEAQYSETIIGASILSWPGNDKLLFYGGGRVRLLFGTVQVIREKHKLEKMDYISGACLFNHASAFKKYGLLTEDYFIYWEETDWCYRAKQQGADLLVCRNAVCYDKISTVIGKGYLANYYYSRNGLLFLSKYSRGNVRLALVGNL